MTSEEQMTAASPGDGQETHGGQEAHGGQETLGGLHMPRLPLPRMPIEMPTGTPGRVLWWGGLAALAAFEVVEWPVAVIVGAGSWVAEQYAKADTAQHSVKAGHEEQAAEHTPSQA